jgi:hypothetical protein
MHPQEIAAHAFRQRFGKEPAHLAVAPGRVNLLGEHVPIESSSLDIITTVTFVYEIK